MNVINSIEGTDRYNTLLYYLNSRDHIVPRSVMEHYVNEENSELLEGFMATKISRINLELANLTEREELLYKAINLRESKNGFFAALFLLLAIILSIILQLYISFIILFVFSFLAILDYFEYISVMKQINYERDLEGSLYEIQEYKNKLTHYREIMEL